MTHYSVQIKPFEILIISWSGQLPAIILCIIEQNKSETLSEAIFCHLRAACYTKEVLDSKTQYAC